MQKFLSIYGRGGVWALKLLSGCTLMSAIVFLLLGKGLLIGGFSGGQPSTNGEFSGVAKNSFLIENGKICRAVTETMINGNLAGMLQRVRGISKETDDSGVFSLPYLAVDGIVISGK